MKKKRIQTDLRGGDVDKFKAHVEEKGEHESVILREIVREYYNRVNTSFNK
jgi:hypothetical protein